MRKGVRGRTKGLTYARYASFLPAAVIKYSVKSLVEERVVSSYTSRNLKPILEGSQEPEAETAKECCLLAPSLAYDGLTFSLSLAPPATGKVWPTVGQALLQPFIIKTIPHIHLHRLI